MQEKSVERNYIYNLLYQILVMIVPLVTTPYVSRVLGATGVGAYSFTGSIVSYFVLIGNFGFATYGQLEIAAKRNNKEQMTIEFWDIFFSRLVVMGLCSVIYAFYIIVTGEYINLYLILYIQIFAAAIDISWLLQGLEEFKKIVIRNLIVKFTSVIFIFLCVKNKNDLLLYVVIMQGSTLLGNASLFVYLKQFLCKINIKSINVKKHIIPSFQYFIPTIATSVYTLLDKSMIGWITRSANENGYYEQAQKIEQMAVTVVTSLSVVTLPRMTFLYKQNKIEEMKERLNSSIKFILFIAFPMMVGLNVMAVKIVPWFLGNGYEKSINLLQIFSVLILVVGLNNAVGKQVLMPIGKQKEYNKSVIIGAIVNFLCNSVLIYKYKSIGAAIASVIAETSILLMFLKFSDEYVRINELLKYSKKYIVSSLIMGIILWKINIYIPSNIIGITLQIVLGICIYFGILLFLKDEFILNCLEKKLLSAGIRIWKR